MVRTEILCEASREIVNSWTIEQIESVTRTTGMNFEVNDGKIVGITYNVKEV